MKEEKIAESRKMFKQEINNQNEEKIEKKMKKKNQIK